MHIAFYVKSYMIKADNMNHLYLNLRKAHVYRT